jgi:hypothetical protein
VILVTAKIQEGDDSLVSGETATTILIIFKNWKVEI